jgi:hypothetical protein
MDGCSSMRFSADAVDLLTGPADPPRSTGPDQVHPSDQTSLCVLLLELIPFRKL